MKQNGTIYKQKNGVKPINSMFIDFAITPMPKIRTQQQTAGYSGTPLAKKLGIKEGYVVGLINAPEDLPELLLPLPASVTMTGSPMAGSDMIHFFTNSVDELSRGL